MKFFALATLCALALPAICQVGSQTPEVKMFRVDIIPKDLTRNGPISFNVPFGWKTIGSLRTAEARTVTGPGTFDRGQFHIEDDGNQQKRMSLLVMQMPAKVGSLDNAADYVTRAEKFKDAPVTVGTYKGHLQEFVMFGGDPNKVRVKYDVLLKVDDQRYIYASMQSFVPKPRAEDRKLFLSIVSSITIPSSD